MHPIIGHNAVDGLQLFLKEGSQTVSEYGTIIGKRHMNIGALIEQGFDQGGGNIGQTAGLGRKVVGHTLHAVGQIRDFRGDDQYSGIALWMCHYQPSIL